MCPSSLLWYASVLLPANPASRMLVLSTLRLAKGREQCSAVVARGLALDTVTQRLAVLGLVGGLDLVHEGLRPVAHQQSCQLLVIRASARHRLFQMFGDTMCWVSDPGDYWDIWIYRDTRLGTCPQMPSVENEPKHWSKEGGLPRYTRPVLIHPENSFLMTLVNFLP